jgi:hypothetical protein
VIDRVGVVQIDSVNVVSRSHYLPFFSRLGPYSPSLLDRAVNTPPRLLFEYWAHEASLLPVDLQPYLRNRMANADDEVVWSRMRRIAREQPELVAWVLDEVKRLGPVLARDIEHEAPRVKDHWGWNWSDVKAALEYLFAIGKVTSAGRHNSFARRYDIPERVLPREVLDAPTPSADQTHRQLVRIAARAHGIASEQCLRDYFRLKVGPARQAVHELVESGELIPAQVEGWARPAFLHSGVRTARPTQARALLSPFDSVIWERARTQALFGFRYRLEIYVRPDKRVHGYYVLPFLLGDQLVARVDLKAHRTERVLRVQSAWAEPEAPVETPAELAAELVAMAQWMGLSAVTVAHRGPLAQPLDAAVRRLG